MKKLVLMSVISIVISVVLTSASLAIYHYSGDIYLDRSRPGYLPDEEEIEENSDDNEAGEYEFSKNGKLTAEELEIYLEALEVEVETLKEYQDPFDDEALSNKHFGL